MRGGVKDEGIRWGEGCGTGGCSMGAEIGLGEGDGEGGVGGEVKAWVAFSPVPVEGGGQYLGGEHGEVAYLITAILTGAVVLAR